MAKKKKQPKVEKVFGKDGNPEEIKTEEFSEVEVEQTSDVDDFLGKETPEDKLSEKQKKKLEKLDNVKSKISKILQSQNIEIVDENFDDDYEYGSADNSDEQSQQDYDSLKAMFGGKDKSKKDELTLTIDDFDYTYIGQYLEEYDLMHLKNIKKVRIQRKKSPKLRKFLLISSIVVVLIVGAVCGFLFTRPQPVYLKNVTLNKAQNVCYVEENFNPAGLYFIAEYSDGTIKTEKLELKYFNKDLTTGTGGRDRITDEENDIDYITFTSSGKVNLVFTYEGFNVTYEVEIKNKVETGMTVVFTSGLFDLDVGDYIENGKTLSLFITHENIKGDGELLEEFSDKKPSITIDDVACTFENNKLKVNKKVTDSSVIKITYNNKYVATITKDLITGDSACYCVTATAIS